MEKVYAVKHYVVNHSCILGATKNRRVIAHVATRRFGEVISGMPSIRPRHVKALVRNEMGVSITNKVCRNAKALVLKHIEMRFREDFKVLNNYALELKRTNPSSIVIVVFEGRMQVRSLFSRRCTYA